MFILLLAIAATIAIVLAVFAAIKLMLINVGVPAVLAYVLAIFVGLLIVVPVLWLVAWLLQSLASLGEKVVGLFKTKQAKTAVASEVNQPKND